MSDTIAITQSPLWVIGEAVVLLLSMHFARLLGRIQGGFAKMMLVGD